MSEVFLAMKKKKKWDLLEGPKGRYGWSYHAYTLSSGDENDSVDEIYFTAASKKEF